MKRVIKKVISISLSIILVAGLVGCTNKTQDTLAVVSTEETQASTEIILWYTNEELTDYIENAANEYATLNNRVVIPKLVSEIDYIENINQAVLSGEAAPDLFVAENCDLEKLYLAGLALENQDTTYSEENYYKTALNSFTYKDKLLAYPLYFETSYLLYNQEYVTTPPSTIEEIMNFANEFDAPEGIENIFNWDVTDILCNYFFVGNYLNNEEINNENYIIDKDKLAKTLTFYQNLNQYFAIDADTVDYEVAFQNFIEGKSVFTIAKTDKLPEIEMIEGDASEDEQEIIQDGNVDAIPSTNEEEFDETKEDETTKEEQTQTSSTNNEASSQNDQTDMEGTSEESNQTSQISSYLTNNYVAGVEKILSQSSSVGIEVNSEDVQQANIEVNEPNATEVEKNTMGTIIDRNNNFKIVPLPNLTSELEGKGIAVSFGVFVNGYTSKLEEASKFAKYLSYDKAATLYKKAGKLSSRNGIEYNNENISNVLKEYEKDTPAPKVMEDGDFWLQLEIAFSNIWKGADVTQTIDELSK